MYYKPLIIKTHFFVSICRERCLSSGRLPAQASASVRLAGPNAFAMNELLVVRGRRLNHLEPIHAAPAAWRHRTTLGALASVFFNLAPIQHLLFIAGPEDELAIGRHDCNAGEHL